MSKGDEYRVHAAECQRMANASTSEDDKRQWLSLTHSWLELIQISELAPVEAFDAETRAKSTGQEESASAH